MDLVIQYIVNGLLIGGVYALAASSVVVIYKATQVFNFAVGEMMAVGMFIAWSVMEMGIPALIAIPAAVLLMALLGWLIERSSLRPLIGQPLIASVMATFALLFILRALMLIIWRGQSSKYPEPLPGVNWQIGTITFSMELTWTFVIAIVTIIAVVLIFQRTRIGLGMRAAAEHQQLAQAQNPRQEYVQRYMDAGHSRLRRERHFPGLPPGRQHGKQHSWNCGLPGSASGRT